MTEDSQGEAPHLTLKLVATLAEVGRASTAVTEFCQQHGIPERDHSALQVVIDELLTNTVSYGFESEGAVGGTEDVTAPHPTVDGLAEPADEDTVEMKVPRIHLDLELAGGALRITIVDNGREFDPFALQQPDTHAELDDRPIGGLGVHIVKELMDDLSYRRESGKNMVRLSRLIVLEDEEGAEEWPERDTGGQNTIY
ncbi:MAG: ATP-binding protein [Acidobacteriota bacterium]